MKAGDKVCLVTKEVAESTFGKEQIWVTLFQEEFGWGRNGIVEVVEGTNFKVEKCPFWLNQYCATTANEATYSKLAKLMAEIGGDDAKDEE